MPAFFDPDRKRSVRMRPGATQLNSTLSLPIVTASDLNSPTIPGRSAFDSSS